MSGWYTDLIPREEVSSQPPDPRPNAEPWQSNESEIRADEENATEISLREEIAILKQVRKALTRPQPFALTWEVDSAKER